MDETSGYARAVTVDGKGGRPRIGKRRDIRLSDEHWRYLTERGEGEAARGLRRIIESDIAKPKRTIKAAAGKSKVTQDEATDAAKRTR